VLGSAQGNGIEERTGIGLEEKNGIERLAELAAMPEEGGRVEGCENAGFGWGWVAFLGPGEADRKWSNVVERNVVPEVEPE
jgi:hypothetical protein